MVSNEEVKNSAFELDNYSSTIKYILKPTMKSS